MQAADLAAARGRYEQSNALCEKLAAQNPDSAQAQRDLSVSFNKLGDVAKQAGDVAAARGRYEQGLAVREKLAAQNPDSAEAQRDLIISYVKLQESLSDASYARRALDVATRLKEQGRLAPTDEWMIDELRQRAET
jgi:tetratricopeptide (TPR) repeat protein